MEVGATMPLHMAQGNSGSELNMFSIISSIPFWCLPFLLACLITSKFNTISIY
jgi:hypothetical protein